MDKEQNFFDITGTIQIRGGATARTRKQVEGLIRKAVKELRKTTDEIFIRVRLKTPGKGFLHCVTVAVEMKIEAEHKQAARKAIVIPFDEYKQRKALL